MLPGPEERFLHDVLSSLPVSVRHPQRVPQQGSGVLRIELTDQRLIAGLALGGLGPRTALTRHTYVTAVRRSRFIAGVHDRLTGPLSRRRRAAGPRPLLPRARSRSRAADCPPARRR